MAKTTYKIPASLNENYMSMEIAIQSKDGVGLKPLPVRVILVWLFSVLALFYLEFNEASIIIKGGLGIQILFAVTWLAFTYLMASVDKSHRMQIELLPALLKYLQKSNRHVLTRRTSNANPFYGIVGIDSIDKDSGMVTYMDGTYGYWFSVVGTASVLLFPEDRDAILDRVGEFYKKIQPDCEIIYITTKEPQKVTRQIAHLMAQHKHLEFKDPDIDALVKEQYETLTNFVGKEFKSLHQYMVIKGDNREALTNINNTLRNECESSAMMFKQCTALYQEDIQAVLKVIYAEGN
ncbi:hypothetical protein J6A31_07490 [bacterium]|nr:hypothetical protein [bacterium]